MREHLLIGATLVSAALAWPKVVSATSLSSYNVAPETVTVSGISSGAFMAVQLDVAYSSRIHGAAIIAGGPYYCAQGSETAATGACESGTGLPSTSSLTAYAAMEAASGDIDPTSNIGGKPIYMFSGTNDTTVHQPVMNALEQFFEQYTSASSIVYNNTTDAAHAWISPLGPNSCTLSYIPYINNCDIDVEETFLAQFYGSLSPKTTGTLTGSFIQFDQTEFCPAGNCSSISMDSTGWAYVPSTCASGSACKLVMALHGCLQYQGVVQQQFVHDSGLNEWADTNGIVVVYPQATTMSGNPLGCWDWWGYTGGNYALKGGVQPTTLMAMVSRVVSGANGVTDGGAPSSSDASSTAQVDASAPPPGGGSPDAAATTHDASLASSADAHLSLHDASTEPGSGTGSSSPTTGGSPGAGQSASGCAIGVVPSSEPGSPWCTTFLLASALAFFSNRRRHR